MAISRKDVMTVIEVVMDGAKQATKYLKEDLTVVATLRGKHRKGQSKEILLTVGRPNYAARQFIRKAKEQGRKFPLSDVHIKWPKENRVRVYRKVRAGR